MKAIPLWVALWQTEEFVQSRVSKEFYTNLFCIFLGSFSLVSQKDKWVHLKDKNFFTGERVLNSDAVGHVLSLMSSCGMSIYSGQFAFNVSSIFFSRTEFFCFEFPLNLLGFRFTLHQRNWNKKFEQFWKISIFELCNWPKQKFCQTANSILLRGLRGNLRQKNPG